MSSKGEGEKNHLNKKTDLCKKTKRLTSTWMLKNWTSSRRLQSNAVHTLSQSRLVTNASKKARASTHVVTHTNTHKYTHIYIHLFAHACTHPQTYLHQNSKRLPRRDRLNDKFPKADCLLHFPSIFCNGCGSWSCRSSSPNFLFLFLSSSFFFLAVYHLHP